MAIPASEAAQAAKYTHGHHASVLRSHSWRTAANSAAFLLPLLKPGDHILDVGCGPGTITVDLAEIVHEGHVTGLEYAPDVLVGAKKLAGERGVSNVDFVTGDVHNLASIADGTFDVVYAHQVLQHVGDPVQALREMKRVCKVGGIVAARDSDYEGFTWYPSLPGMDKWNKLYLRVAANNGGEPNAGRQLHAFARKAGFDPIKITKSAGTWCYSSLDEVAWWSDLWAERTQKSNFALSVQQGLATQADLDEVSEAWREWGRSEDAWFCVLHGEILCKV
ncbi:hypothetical protein RQP46_000152 [Phenoliferia psychrophenolica]